jgi:3-hydroxyanthranilate 3,4-dioxygenase
MNTPSPFNLQKWVDEHRHLLKPPVGNQQIFTDNADFIVMVVGGPNARKDYHIDAGEELFYQLEGTIKVGLIIDGKPVENRLGPGDMMLVPPNMPHKPMRGPGTIGLVIERYRNAEELDAFVWHCENCFTLLYRAEIKVNDIVADLPVIMNTFFTDEKLHTCQNCGTVMERPT